MKCIRATVAASALDDLRTKLLEVGATGLTFSQVHEFGERGMMAVHRGAIYAIDFVPKIALEVVVRDSLLRAAVEAVLSVEGTGLRDEEEVVLVPVQTAVRIRTGERDDAAV
jgi:nitrogen regulatory protein P-II 1